MSATPIDYRPRWARIDPNALRDRVDIPYIGVAPERLPKKHRQSLAKVQDIVGTLVAVDLSNNHLKLALDSGRTIRGTFSPLIGYPLSRALGLRVRLNGLVEIAGSNQPRSVKALSMEQLESLPQ